MWHEWYDALCIRCRTLPPINLLWTLYSTLPSALGQRPLSRWCAHSVSVLQVLRKWHSHCLAISAARHHAQERTVAAQRRKLYTALLEWRAAPQQAIRRRALVETVVLHRVRSQQAWALHAWGSFTNHRSLKHAKKLQAYNHFRHSRLRSICSHWHGWACGKSKTVRSLAQTRERMRFLPVVEVLGMWRDAASACAFDRKMLPVAEWQRGCALLTQSFRCYAAFATFSRAIGDKTRCLEVLARKRSSEGSLAVWHDSVQHEQALQCAQAQYTARVATRTLLKVFRVWCDLVEAIRDARRRVKQLLCPRGRQHWCTFSVSGMRVQSGSGETGVAWKLLYCTGHAGTILSSVVAALYGAFCLVGMLLCGSFSRRLG